jgi:deoxyribodipyrimidine photolyase-like uncharacterized protein
LTVRSENPENRLCPSHRTTDDFANFMNLAQFNPDEVYQWFMEMFIDSYDWVMVPNVYGMSSFSDGGK